MKPAGQAKTSTPLMTAATVFVDAENLHRIRTSLADDGVEVIQMAELEEAIQSPVSVILLDADCQPDDPFGGFSDRSGM